MAQSNVVLSELHVLAEKLGNQAKVAELLDVDKSSVTRWMRKEDVPSLENEERIAALRFLLVKLQRIFLPQTATDWLLGVNAHLGDKRPIDLIKAGRVAEVLAAIQQADAGSYA